MPPPCTCIPPRVGGVGLQLYAQVVLGLLLGRLGGGAYISPTSVAIEVDPTQPGPLGQGLSSLFVVGYNYTTVLTVFSESLHVSLLFMGLCAH